MDEEREAPYTDVLETAGDYFIAEIYRQNSPQPIRVEVRSISRLIEHYDNRKIEDRN